MHGHRSQCEYFELLTIYDSCYGRSCRLYTVGMPPHKAVMYTLDTIQPTENEKLVRPF